MLIHFYTCAYPLVPGDRNLYSDLMDEMASLGHEVRVFCPDESRAFGPVARLGAGAIQVFALPIGRIQKTNPVLKLINTTRFGRRLVKEALRKAAVDPPDLLLFSTPPIHVGTAVAKIRADSACGTYLLLKDIFPANAVDMGMLPEGGLVWRHFRRQEKALYACADVIGCMSPANKAYLVAHNPELDPARIDVCPNCIRPTPQEALPPRVPGILRTFGIPEVPLNLIYGGNLGVPQGVDFLIEVLRATQGDPDVHVTIVGDGTEFSKLERLKAASGNAFTLLRRLDKGQYLALLRSMDAGLLFLDRRFTIPNFPSRLLDYLDCGLPVLAATDRNTDVGEVLHQAGCGLWSEAGDLPAYLQHLGTLKQPEVRRDMGHKGRRLLDEEFSARRGAELILSRLASAHHPRAGL